MLMRSAVKCIDYSSELKSICAELDLHKVVITYFTEIQSFIYTIGFLVKKRFSVELISFSQLKVNVFHIKLPGILRQPTRSLNEAIIDHMGRTQRKLI